VAKTNEEILQFGVEVNPRDAIAAFAKIQKGITNHLQRIDKESQRLGKVSGKIWKGMASDVNKTYQVAIKESTEAQKTFGVDLTRIAENQRKAQTKYVKGLQKRQDLEKSIRNFRKQEDKLGKAILKTDTKDKDALASGRAELKELVAGRQAEQKMLGRVNDGMSKQEDIFSKLSKEAEEYKTALKDADKYTSEMREKLEEGLDMKEMAEGLKEGGERLRAPLKALLNNDLPEAAEATAKLIGQGMIGGMKLGAKFLRGRGEKADDGKGGGKLMKAAAGKLEGAAASFGRLAPMFSVIVDGLKEALQIFLKLDSMVKDFNASITEGSDSAKFLAARGGDASAAYKDVSNQLEKVRNKAHSLENLELGITPEQHAQTLNALGQEGQGMFEISEAAKKANIPVEELSNSLVKASVAFGRHMGVSVAEITQLQSQMATDIGVSLDQTDKQLAMLSMTAAESGMATNKFFNIIRSSSDDMNLFNNRMEDSARLLKMLGKAMAPKDAAKFMKSLTSLVGGQDLQSRLKLTLFAGKDEAQQIGMKDTDRRIADMAKDFQLSAAETAEMTQAIHKGMSETNTWLAKNTKLTAAQKGNVTQAALDTSKYLSGDLVNIASAAKNLGPKAGADLINKGLSKMPGLKGKSIDTLTGTDYIATSVFGLTEEVIDGYKKMMSGTDQMKQELVNKLKANADLTAEDQALLKKLGIDAKDGNAAAQLDAKDTDSVWGAMSTLQQDTVQGIKDVYNVQAAIAKDTVSMAKNLDIIAGSVKNWIADKIGPAAAGALGGAVEVGGGVAKMALAQVVATKALAAGAKALAGPAIEAAVVPAVEAAVVPAVEAAVVPAAATAATALTGAGVAAGAAVAAAGVAAGAAVGAVGYNLYKLWQETHVETTGGDHRTTDAEMAAARAKKTAELAAAQKPPGAASTTPGAASTTPGAASTTPGAAPTAPVNPAPIEVKGQALDAIKTGMDNVIQGTKDTGIAEVTKTIRDQNEITLTDGFGVLAGILRRDVKLDKSFVNNELGPMVEKSVLEAVRVALVEYSLYKDMSAAQIQTQAAGPGFNAKTFGSDLLNKVATPMTAHAEGGFVVGQNPDGSAKVLKAPAGEMPTSIGPGETIAPSGAGGGGTNISVTVNGIGGNDLANMVKVAATNAIYEYKRREHLN